MTEAIHDPKVRYLPTDRGDGWLCEDCGVLVLDKTAHTRFHSILSGHAWALAVLKTHHNLQRRLRWPGDRWRSQPGTRACSLNVLASQSRVMPLTALEEGDSRE